MKLSHILSLVLLSSSCISLSMEWTPDNALQDAWTNYLHDQRPPICCMPDSISPISVQELIDRGILKQASQENSSITPQENLVTITPDSFNSIGKKILLGYVTRMHAAAAEQPPLTKGLAAICNSIPATEEGVSDLIHDENCLDRANAYYNFLENDTSYPKIVATFREINRAGFPGCEKLALDTQRTLTSILLYKKLWETSDIRMPEQNMGMAFMETTDNTANRRILECNSHIDVESNTIAAKGVVLATAYSSQRYIFPDR